MPELPEVEVIRRGLESRLTGRMINHVEILRPDLRYPLPDLNMVLSGHKLRRIERRAKYLLFFFDHVLLVWHLGMTGQFHILPQDIPTGAHEHVRIFFNDDHTLRYRDSRRFGYAGLLSLKGWQQHPWFKHLGPEPLGDGFTTEYFAHCCEKRKSPVKPILMNAAIVAGIGNIYACEALFHARIHPARGANRISKIRLQRLFLMIRQILREAIDAGGSSINDFVQVDGKPGYFAYHFRVYGRAGKPCMRCGKAIARMIQSGRATFYCPQCQR
ncbi:MAG: bifunctional DNA-formamidopyrimidine glycosylase/DNA-(apurinic or apyrimidinic site) lyase [Mariprofundaceae bacterium]|nr:bifunctional DNA-formamidopyrimidine glycosylase/DNA-(apurinic or apyrimidinic site) lyase [Mariprofundaceae bacterium]